MSGVFANEFLKAEQTCRHKYFLNELLRESYNPMATATAFRLFGQALATGRAASVISCRSSFIFSLCIFSSTLLSFLPFFFHEPLAQGSTRSLTVSSVFTFLSKDIESLIAPFVGKEKGLVEFGSFTEGGFCKAIDVSGG